MPLTTAVRHTAQPGQEARTTPRSPNTTSPATSSRSTTSRRDLSGSSNSQKNGPPASAAHSWPATMPALTIALAGKGGYGVGVTHLRDAEGTVLCDHGEGHD